MLRYCCLFLITALVLNIVQCSEVVELNTANFEHLTQASTGHTTGDWLVKFYAPWCGHCKTLAPVLEEVADELKGDINVAHVDVTQSRDLGTRFGIKGFPTVMLFSNGLIYTYKGRRTVEDLVVFAKGGFKTQEAEEVPKELGMFGEMVNVFKTVYREGMKDINAQNYLTHSVLLMVMPFIFLSFMILLIVSSPGPEPKRRSKGEAEKEE